MNSPTIGRRIFKVSLEVLRIFNYEPSLLLHIDLPYKLFRVFPKDNMEFIRGSHQAGIFLTDNLV